MGRRMLDAGDDEDAADCGDVGEDDPKKEALVGLEVFIADTWSVNLSGDNFNMDLRTFPF